MNAREIILVSTGTRGDVAPFIAYGKKIQKRGRRVTLLSNSEHASLSMQHSIPFAAISAPDWAQLNRDEWAFFNDVVVPGYYATHRYVAAILETGAEVEIVARTGAWGAQYVAEKFALPFTRIALQPCAIRQNGHPAEAKQIAILNDFRQKIGLRRIETRSTIPENWSNTISFFPEWFGGFESRLPKGGVSEGFISLDDEGYEPDSELNQFLTSHRPIVISLGSGVQQIEIFWEAAKTLAVGHRLPVIFLSPYIASRSVTQSPLLMARAYADHGYILKRANVFINNGGIGAVAQGIRAEIPQIVIPLIWDQPDNARRLHASRMGATLALEDVSSERFITEVRSMYRA